MLEKFRPLTLSSVAGSGRKMELFEPMNGAGITE